MESHWDHTGDWGFHIHCIRRLTPLFNATGHLAHAKSTRLYVQDIDKLVIIYLMVNTNSDQAKKQELTRQSKLHGVWSMTEGSPSAFWPSGLILILTTSWASCQIRKIAGAHAPGMPGTFSPSPQVSDPDMHHGTCVTHVPWCMPGSLTSGFLWNRRRGEMFPAFPAHAQPAILRIW